ncbi:LamG-like jellyroll fold domain-containing protein [Acinetobacter towneri]|uniref:LamG-like jellyroll fold domain-containing protein n=1 Tax=Acinetobacter towneri TaxID=202956 RepID=UPI0020974655|nr:LamG-like jellyroll fold domain-containing protein [Acinetobacter towneri]MCO8058043.1 LamG domain-containing protein [Acinetobacter towneri]MCO8063689.1 LamG domain-containing protein [Acinetobacter towneri]
MTIKIDYAFNVDGFYDSVNYYRSLTPMSPLSMPAPTATGITGLTYSDTTAAADTNYFVRFGSVKNSIEKISDEISVYSKNLTHYTAFFDLNSSLIDRKDGASLALIEGVLAYENNGLKLNGASYVRREATSAVHFSTSDFTVECEFKAADVGSTAQDQVLINTYSQNVQPTWQLVLSASGEIYVWLYFGAAGSITLMQGSANLLDGNLHKVKWTRQSGVSKLFVDNVEVASAVDTSNYALPQYLEIGAQTYRPIGQAYYFKGLIRNVGLAKQVI